MKEYKNQVLTGERALFDSHGVKLTGCVFNGGESPLKESSDIELKECIFEWKYPLWYCKNVKTGGCSWYETGRAGVWYTSDISVDNAVIQAPKNFRRCRGVKISNSNLSNAAETM
jgi:hypothetical protein